MLDSTAEPKGVALVTGASRGIGRVAALLLAEAGHPVAVNFRSAEADARAVVQAIRRAGGCAVAMQADVSSAEGAVALVHRVEVEMGPLDILINNAGITRDRLLLHMSQEDWDAIWATDLVGPRAAARAALGLMGSRRRGTIVNVSSVVGSTGNAGQANYASAKSAILGLTRELALNGAARNVTVNCVIPGFVETDATAHLNAGQREAWLRRIPMARCATAEEVAAVISFLTTSSAAYITGQCIAVDGGLLAAGGAGLAS